MTITIKTLSNGAAVTVTGEAGSAYKFGGEDLGGLSEMLYDIIDVLEPGSRYSEKRVRVKIEHGDKYNCQAGKNCEVCGGKAR